jgi:hypothetical protein
VISALALPIDFGGNGCLVGYGVGRRQSIKEMGNVATCRKRHFALGQGAGIFAGSIMAKEWGGRMRLSGTGFDVKVLAPEVAP